MDNKDCTGLEIVPLTPDYPYLDCLNDILDEAFPANERLASRDITSFSKDSRYVILVFEDDHVPVGFLQMLHCGEDAYYVMYLAIGKEFRNRSYGSRVMKLAADEYLKGKIVFGCVEALLPEAPNYQQRVDRVRFYQRNGMVLLDEVIDVGEIGKYQLVCNDPNVTSEQLKAKMPAAMPFLM